MSNFETIQDWINIHTDGTCEQANDCLISLAQAMQKELSRLSGEESHE